MRRLYGWLGVALAGCVATAPSIENHREVDWAKMVLLGTEVGDARDAVVRWQHPVRYLVVAAPARVRRAVDRAHSELQEALAGVLQVELEHVSEQDERVGSDGFVTIFAKAPRDAAELAKRHGAQVPHADADGWFTIIWNRSFELTRAVVFVDPNLSNKWLRHTALEEMFQALGPSNDSAAIRDSLVFESRDAAGSHDRLARVDRQVLHLLYKRLQPGDRASEIERAMRRSWVFADRVDEA